MNTNSSDSARPGGVSSYGHGHGHGHSAGIDGAPPDGAPPDGAPMDRYVVLDYLAEGGMGAIYIGRKLGAGGFAKPVVLKQLLPDFTSQVEFRELFLHEARLSATLDHANIIHTIDLVNAGDEHFIVMEYLDGADLRTLLQKARRRRKRLSAAAAIYVAREILSALAYAHQKEDMKGVPLDLIHRDVSPSNVLISKNGEVKLTDFGIAKVANHNSGFFRVKGKIGYMSPEQAHSKELDQRTDLYSLAVCLYEMLTGEKLFVHVGLTTPPEEIYSQAIPSVSQKVAEIPAEFDHVMYRALHIDPNQRYQTAGAFQEALLRSAHRAGLMMSAPELASHLRKVCGDPMYWRDLENDGPSAPEMYERDHEGTEKIDIADLKEDVDDANPGMVASQMPPSASQSASQSVSGSASMTSIERFRGVELTSIIRGEQDQPPAHEANGPASPLVNLDEMGRGGPTRPSAYPLAPGQLDGGQQPQQSASQLQGRGQPPSIEVPAEALAGPPVTLHSPPVASLQPQSQPQHQSQQQTARTNMPAPQPTHTAPTSAPPFSRDAAPVPVPGNAASSRISFSHALTRTWPIWILIFLLGIGVAALIGLSGPSLGDTETFPQSSDREQRQATQLQGVDRAPNSESSAALSNDSKPR